MKVSELIEFLQKFPPDLDCIFVNEVHENIVLQENIYEGDKYLILDADQNRNKKYYEKQIYKVDTND